ncbi:MAG TPA: 5'-nucleotidase C-terminal domain-containing protein, partial [Nakamurella multipartita]|nr:5'-nucleotidase C-terminal domain-containing protein [Nakamurella multipartita]
IVQTGSYGANVGQIKLTVDRDTDTVTGSTVANVPRVGTADATLLAQYPARLTPIKATVDAALAVANQRGNVPVGSITADITTAFTPATPPAGVDRCVAGAGRDDRASESTLGNLVANALVAQLSAPEYGGAEIGVVNPGGLRSDLCFAANTASWSNDGPGLVMYGEANAVLPFANDLFVTSLTGAQFKTALEQQWQRDAAGNIPTRPYLQLGLSDNVTYTFDPSAPEGSRITSVTIDGRPLDPAKTYRIGSFSFLLQGGDNFRIFTAGTDTTDSGLVDRDAWIDYLKANPKLAPDFARHAVKVTNQPTTAAAGATVTFDVAGLDLTSLGAPANSSLEAALLPVGGGAPAAKEAFAVSGGAARVEFDVPAQIAAGAWNLVLTATPSGTTVTIPLTITATSSVTLTADRSSQVYGAANPLTLTATVVTSDAGAAGSVEFRTGSTVLASVPVVGGQAAFTLPSSTPAGSYPIVAHYTGAGGVPPADSATVTVTVSPAGSVTVLAPALVVPFLGTILVGAVGLNNGQPARGSIEIRDNGSVVGSTAVQSHGLFVFLAPRPGKGQHSYTATFVPGDPANITGSTSNPVVVRR